LEEKNAMKYNTYKCLKNKRGKGAFEMKKLAKQAIVLALAILLLAGLATPALATPHPFSDVPDGRWFSEAVQYVYEHNIMGGVGGGRFDPQGSLTRAQVMALLFRVHNGRTANAQDDRNNSFNDVTNEWFAPYVTWAFNNDIVTGTSPTTFNPHGNITRQEFATMVYRYAMNMTSFIDRETPSAWWVRFADRGQIASWAYSPLRWMNFRGVVTGSTEATINPTGTATRAEAAVMMMRFVELFPPPTGSWCLGCGDERTYFIPGDNEEFEFEDDVVVIVLTRCVSQRDNRDWTLDDFGNIGALYIEDWERLSDREWELIQAGRWQETFVNWPQFRRIMMIRLDQNCIENVGRVVYQLYQQHEFIRWVGPEFIFLPA